MYEDDVCNIHCTCSTVPCADVVVRGHSERVAAGGEQSCQLTVSLAPKVTFSENTVLLSLQRRGEDRIKIHRNRSLKKDDGA